MILEAISKVSNNEDLSYEVAEKVLDEIMTGESTPAQNAAFLTALHMKGETIDEVTASASVLRKHCGKFEYNVDETIDIVGTGGDCAGTINISTIASLIASAAGAHVAKHGNRAASSKCGTADCLEALGVKIDTDEVHSKKALEEAGMCFLYAQKYHPAMRFVGGVRREIKIPTMFNILGPLANPAKANLQLFGVYKEELVEPLAHVLYNLGVKRGMVVYGMDGLDEISMSAKTKVCDFVDGNFEIYELDPRDYGFELCNKEDLVGGTPEENAKIARDILNGAKGPKTDAVVLNAAAALHITNQISIEEGVKLAKEALETGAAAKQLESLINITNEI